MIKKIFILGFVAFLWNTGITSAMTLSQPTYIGEISTEIQSPYGGYVIKGATHNNGDYFTQWKKDGRNYGKGIAAFEKEADTLYCHYNYYEASKNNSGYSERFGASDLANTVAVDVWHNGDIRMIKSDEGLTFYAIRFEYCTSFITVIGKNKDGKWIKYFDTRDINKEYGIPWGYKENGGILYEKVKTSGDTIILPYHRWYWSTYGGESQTEGEFRFQWDEDAQWFGVEQVVY